MDRDMSVAHRCNRDESVSSRKATESRPYQDIIFRAI